VDDGSFADWTAAVDSLKAADPDWAQELEAHSHAEQVGDEAVLRFFRFELRLTSDKNMAYADGNALGERWEAWLQGQMAEGACAATADTFWGMVSSWDFHRFEITGTLMSEMRSGVATSVTVALVVLVLVTGNLLVGAAAAACIGLIVLWVMAVIPTAGWDLGIVENIVLVMVPGLSVDFTAHLAEAYCQAKYDNREHRVVHALEHSGVSIVSGSLSTGLAALCLMTCKIIFFKKFGALILCTVFFAVLFSLFFFPSLMALIGPTGTRCDWHAMIHPKLQAKVEGQKKLRVSPRCSAKQDSVQAASPSCADELGEATGPPPASARSGGERGGEGPAGA